MFLAFLLYFYFNIFHSLPSLLLFSAPCFSRFILVRLLGGNCILFTKDSIPCQNISAKRNNKNRKEKEKKQKRELFLLSIAEQDQMKSELYLSIALCITLFI